VLHTGCPSIEIVIGLPPVGIPYRPATLSGAVMVSWNELPFWEYFQEVETVPAGRETVADTCVKSPGWGIT
jgi:hypothetical protein